MSLYRLIRPAFFRLDAEKAHDATLRLLELVGGVPTMRHLLRALFAFPDPGLSVRAFGLDFCNPLGLAAGYDKDGRALDGLASLGFGHIELGTVTPLPQPGNPKPRVFRLVQDQALINRMGFPNQGAAKLRDRLKRGRRDGVVFGVNIGKGVDTPLERAVGDYTNLLSEFHSIADYAAINVSSPNTIGLRRLQARTHLEKLLSSLDSVRTKLEVETGIRTPLLVKLSPDLSEAELEDALEAIVSSNLDGIIATNTTINRNGLRSPASIEAGGLSGAPLRRRSLEMVRHIRRLAGDGLCIVGVGGIASAADAREMLEAGANLVQLYSGLVYHGPGLVRQILRGLREN
jgi:dihydroorotate dehydrogenase